MQELGVLVGCDQTQEWLLPWWWHYYARYNSFPVVFADFGMSEQAIAWCASKGSILPSSSEKRFSDQKISDVQKAAWEQLYGLGIWDRRRVWFKKPQALLQSSFCTGLWLDLDCQVKGNLEPIFRSLSFGAEVGVVKEPDFIQTYERNMGHLLPGEISYNSGVIVFRRNADILHYWMEELTKCHEKYAGDQAALSRAMFFHCPVPSLIELPPEYNWLRMLGPNRESLIHHFTGSPGKEEILLDIQSLRLVR